MELVARFLGIACAQHCLLSRGGPFWTHTDGGEHLAHARTGVEVVVGNQSVHVLQFWDCLLTHWLAYFLEVEYDGELCALAHLTIDSDGSVHDIDNVLCDCHAKTRALNAADGGSFLTCEWLEDVTLVLWTHADASILDAELIFGIALTRTRSLDDAQTDGAARRGKLDGIAEDIEQNLVETQLIDHDILMNHILNIDEEVELLCLDVRLHD